MKRLLVLAALALAWPGAAAAKEITAVEVCGADGCVEAEVPAGPHDAPGAGGGIAYPAAVGPFVEVRLVFDGRHREALWYVPGARAFAGNDGPTGVRWTRASTQPLDRAIAAAATRVEPFVPRAVAAAVANRRVDGDPSGYLGLFALPSAGAVPRDGGGGFVNVTLETVPLSPWARTDVWFYPETGSLQRGAEMVLLPPSVAADLAAGRPIRAAEDRRSPLPWAVPLALVGGLLLLAGANRLAGRSRGRIRTA